MKSRVVTSAGSVVAAAATGLVTNVLSNNWALTWWLALGVLVTISVVLQLVITAQTKKMSSSDRKRDALDDAPAQGLPSSRQASVMVGVIHMGGGVSNIAGGDITINHFNDSRGESQIELSAVTLAETGPPRSSAVLDVKLRNVGGQPAILHKATLHVHDALSMSPYHVVGFLPYEELWVRGVLQVSETYDLALLPPEEAIGSHHDLELSQAIEPYGTDRIHIRLGIPPTQDTIIYLLTFNLFYDTHGGLTSPTVAIAHPPGSSLVAPDAIRSDLHEFWQAIRKVRGAVNREMAARNLPTPDWDNHPPASRADLPPGLLSIDGDPQDPLGIRPGTYEVNDAFWNPHDSFAQHVDYIHVYYERVVRIINDAHVRHSSLPHILTEAQTVLAQLPAIAEEFEVGM
jgi:hypothetical protein